jgi:hypothetical protein
LFWVAVRQILDNLKLNVRRFITGKMHAKKASVKVEAATKVGAVQCGTVRCGAVRCG